MPLFPSLKQRSVGHPRHALCIVLTVIGTLYIMLSCLFTMDSVLTGDQDSCLPLLWLPLGFAVSFEIRFLGNFELLDFPCLGPDGGLGVSFETLERDLSISPPGPS